MRKLLLVAALLGLAGCTAGPADDPAATAPPDTITRYPSTAPAAPPSVVARENGATVAAALPTDADVPGFTRAADAPTELKLCPTRVQTLPASVVHQSARWQGADRGLYVTAVLDPKQAPADTLLATLTPQDCPEQADGWTYVYDRQPFERSDGWTGTLNTILSTAADGRQRYESVYLLSKGDALVNVVASRENRATFDPTVDEAAAHYVELVLARFAA